MGEWSNTLFSCFSDMKICVCVYFLPCVAHGKVAETLGESCGMIGCLTLVPIANLICAVKIRGKIRESKEIEGSALMDCLTFIFCGACALCQEVKEVGAELMSGSMARD